MSDRSNAQIIAEALTGDTWANVSATAKAYWLREAERIVAALEAEGRLTPAVQGDAKLLQNSARNQHAKSYATYWVEDGDPEGPLSNARMPQDATEPSPGGNDTDVISEAVRKAHSE